MNLTPEQKELGRRNFLQAVSGREAMEAVAAMLAVEDAPSGAPVKVGFVGVGQQGRVLLGRASLKSCDVRAMCDINPAQLQKADEVLQKAGRPPARHYTEWREMLEKEDIEAVLMAPPLWMHAELAAGALEAGKHVLCEKMMAWDVEGCERMAEAARKGNRVLEIGYQRNYNPIYVAAYNGVVRPGLLGDVYHARTAWHRNRSWRREGEPPSPDYDPSRWGYPTFDHLYNWRLFWRYSKGLFAELGSHQIQIVNWFFGAHSTRVAAAGGLERFKEGGREVFDHVYATWEYPGGRTAMFSSIESNSLEGAYEAFFGTKATLILSNEREAYLLYEEQARGLAPESGAAEAEAESRAAHALGWSEQPNGAAATSRVTSSGLEIATFCAAIRSGRPLACGPQKAQGSARACLRANESAQKKEPIAV